MNNFYTTFAVPLTLLAFLIVSACSTQDRSTTEKDHPHNHSRSTTKENVDSSKRLITGNGKHTYEMLPSWNDVPNSHIGPTHGDVVTERDGTVYVSTDRKGQSIMEYSPDGELRRTFGNDFTGIHHLTLRRENGDPVLYATHLKGKQIVKLRTDGSKIWSFGYEKIKKSGKYKNRKQFKPTAATVGPDGDIYVADGYGTSWIHQFDQNLNYIRSFGGPGTKPGKFNTCHGIALDTRYEEPRLLISDRENRRLQHFDLEGNFKKVISNHLRRPCKVAFYGPYVAVAELEGRVTILNKKNVPVAFLGDNPEEWQWANYNVPPKAWDLGSFTAPHGLSFDSNGNLYVQDWNKSGRLTKLKPLHKKKK